MTISQGTKYQALHEAVLESSVRELAARELTRFIDGEYSSTILGYSTGTTTVPTRTRDFSKETILPLDSVVGITLNLVIPREELRQGIDYPLASPRHAALCDHMMTNHANVVEEFEVKPVNYVAPLIVKRGKQEFHAAIVHNPKHYAQRIEDFIPHQNGAAKHCNLIHQGDKSFPCPSKAIGAAKNYVLEKTGKYRNFKIQEEVSVPFSIQVPKFLNRIWK